MENPKIFINGIEFGDRLKLSDNGTTEVDSDTEFRVITWETTSDDVPLFYLVPKKGHNPFDTPIPQKYRKKHILTVKKCHPTLDWNYAIVWLDRANDKHTHDPKIAIKSSRKDTFDHNWPWQRWLGLGLGLLGLALWLTAGKDKDKSKS